MMRTGTPAAVQDAARHGDDDGTGPGWSRAALLPAGVPVVLLHGVSGAGGFVDEIVTFGLLGGLVAGLTFLSFRGARKKKGQHGRRPRR